MKNTFTILFLLFCFGVRAQNLKDCSMCAEQIIKPEQIKNLSIDELRFLTNDLFARKGYVFANSKFQNYFADKSWYKSLKSNMDMKFNDIEKQNIQFIQADTKKLEEQRKGILTQLKVFKNDILHNDHLNLQQSFNYKAEDKYDTENLLSVMKKIDLEDLHWYKYEGIHKILVDDGFVIIEYSVKIEREKISIIYNFMNSSEIIKDLDIYTDYQSEGEHMYNWEFEYRNNKMNFIRLVVAG